MSSGNLEARDFVQEYLDTVSVLCPSQSGGGSCWRQVNLFKTKQNKTTNASVCKHSFKWKKKSVEV